VLLSQVEKQRTDVGEMCNPSDVTFLPDESTLVVAEYDSVNERNNRLQLFDRLTGRTIGALAQSQMQPLGVTATRDGQHLVVTDCRGKRVRLLSLPTGQTVADIGKGQFGWPYGVALTSHGQVVVTDAFNDTVSVYSPDGKRLKIFGGSGSGSSRGTTFRNPYHVAVDDRDVILVSDFGNNAVKAFDLTGRFIYCASESTQRWSSDLFGSISSHLPLTAGSAGGGCAAAAAAAGGKTSAAGKRRRLKGPRGIAIECRQRHVIVADDRSRVCMFSSGGQYVRNLLTEDDSVKYPEAIECSRSGLLAVTEWNQNNAFAIKLFNLYE
jgi:DNA-binding beta-propeller fold protein YncE